MNKIFTDNWAWYAMVDKSDNDHTLAEAANTKLLDDGYFFVTTNYVLSESVTLIRYKLYHEIAVRFWNMTQRLIDTGLVELIRVTEAHEAKAWKIFERYTDKKFSFTDCTSFAVMQELGLSHCFTADHHFAAMGFILVP